ncbi:alpha/beta hydrolase family protein [Chitinophaga nivalis]|uniref:Prolyl oligopeptidase family serine peptidase n=1 Tax=Chitinophaga nivalis TaxID=2991709 RepID=A0ABT3IR35_9BACT|nr:prolyl oligopeptidase family serine peptidase [Chitinophaga nivalis]MCW3463868.1 prolyl oligopeptidase family serine peptidase [Chitinophaga nivalis]MCW3486442.1 prolyl oligopeptidase family serine peptidase [Chitinophaga nivalis]
MRKIFWGLLLMSSPYFTYAQQHAKKPLDHSVYDSWQSIGTKLISNNGQWVVYTVTPQEGDASLVIYDRKTNRSMTIPRGSNPLITADSRYVAFSIKPFFRDTREAKIKKKKPAEMPKDSLGIVTLGQSDILKFAAVKSFKAPEKGGGLLAWLQETPADTARTKGGKAAPAPASKDREDDDKRTDADKDGGVLIIRQLAAGVQDTIKNVTSYAFSKPGNSLLAAITSNKKDSLSRTAVLLWHAGKGKADTLSRGYGDYKQLALDEKGEQAAYFGTRDSAKALQQFYQLYYFKPGQDSALAVAGKNSTGIPQQWTVNPNSALSFSKDGQRLLFGTAPVRPPKDTTIVDFEVAKVDIWNYKDDYLQPMQLKNADKELKRSYAAVYHTGAKRIVQLGDQNLESIFTAQEGNSPYALGYTDKGARVPLQWIGRTLKTAYLVNIQDGSRKLIKEKLDGYFTLSPNGKYITWYDLVNKQWFVHNNATGAVIPLSKGITTALADEEDDHPDVPEPYGLAGWLKDDRFAYIYDRYDIWQVDPEGKIAPVVITAGNGRKTKTRYLIVKTNPEQTGFVPNETLLLSTFADSTKYNGYYSLLLPAKAVKGSVPQLLSAGPFSFTDLLKAKDAPVYTFTRASYTQSPDVYTGTQLDKATKISSTNPQQQNYNWGTASLYKWTTFSGKSSEGILYKPEDFDSTKKYPVIFYFYEKLTDGLYSYQAPAPTPSRLNISFFVSRGYLVFAPDISYENGYPGKSAYDYIVSAAETLAKQPWVDGKNMGIQGQSWGGYQVAYLITQTNIFKAAWAGAPVANMTSAYGGIRWESGMNRQFQYEHSQSRIGATLWEKPELYIENSPLFNLPRVNTPVAIMANDADGAVPWYQGIEMFTGLRRLGKPVWMLNYNNEAHNLIQRQNRKDIQRREQQFFDHFLKGAPAPQWLESGVPATEKGINWGWE